MLVAMAGLPGTGKSTIARRLADRLGGVVLSKDTARAALFPPAVLDYSTEQDDLTMRAVYAAAAHVRRTAPDTPVFLDGRTFSRAYQVIDLLAAAESSGDTLRVIECVCADDVAHARLTRDLAAGTHPAANRTPALYAAAKARADPLTLPRLTLDTGVLAADECVRLAVEYLVGAYGERDALNRQVG